MYAGNDLILKINAYNPLTGATIPTDSTVTVHAYHPSKDPRNDADDRADPDYTATLNYEEGLLAYYGVMPTAGWALGVWTLQTVITGELDGHDYRTITLTAG